METACQSRIEKEPRCYSRNERKEKENCADWERFKMDDASAGHRPPRRYREVIRDGPAIGVTSIKEDEQAKKLLRMSRTSKGAS